MKSSWFKKLVPHAIAVLIFLIVALIYCKPVFEGKVVSQFDITQWKGTAQQSEEYAKTHNGVHPLWTNSVFSGMPTFHIAYDSNNKIPWIAHTIFSLGLPKPISFFFLASICFYFLCVVLRIRTVFAILGSLAFAYATYNAVIISVGHDTKMLSMAYMPALLGSIILIYEKKYWLGTGLTALLTSILIIQNHPQIAYYLFLTIGIMSVFYAIRWIKNKEWRHFGIAAACVLAAGLTGVMTNAVGILSTYEYQKETIRGGGSALVDSTTQNENAKTGLSKDYALSYSMEITEPLIMIVPRMYGGSNDPYEVSEEKSKAVERLRAMPNEVQQQLSSLINYYWGGMTKPGEVGVSGPAYVGAVICVLAILAMFVLDGKHKWWILTAVGITIVMSWGSYFEAFNGLLYKYLPLYNKFRAPSMILVIPQLLLPMLAVLGLEKIVSTEKRAALLPAFKKGLIATGGVFGLLLIIYAMSDFMSGSDNDIMSRLKGATDPQTAQLLQFVSSLFDGLREDRKSMMLGDIFRSLIFGAIALALVYFAIRRSISDLVFGIGLTVLVMIDLLTIDVKYLNYNNYKDKEENEAAFVKTKADSDILADTSFFRVFNVAGFQENNTSYFHNSVGGYHAAKLAIYQDLIEHKLNRQQTNTNIFNMLNVKYFIQKDRNGQTQAYEKNESALGNCWLVKHIQYVKNANEEMALLGTMNPRDTALVEDAFKSAIPFAPAADSLATIALVKNDNDLINYTFNASTNQFAVFSEIYYKGGWKAYIDDKEAPIVKVNYVLRGLAVPAGKHNIRFEFKPGGYYKGKKLTSIFSVILLIFLAVGIFMEWRNRNQAALANRV